MRISSTFLVAALFALVAEGAQASPIAGLSSAAPGQHADLAETASVAMDALNKGDYAKAIQGLEKLTKISPSVAEFQANLCMAYYSAGRPQDATVPCSKALKLKPALVSAHYFLGISLAESGGCKEALSYLEKDYPRLADQRLKRVMGIDGAECANSVDEPYRAVGFLQWLNRDFPDDPQVLYLSTHIFSDLSARASERLLHTAPTSYQARQLYAEVLKVQGKIADAIIEYRKVLAMAPHLPGIHSQIGRLLLAEESDSATLDAARKEFEEELQISPDDAASEYELGEMARQARKWDQAIEHFGRAVKNDPDFPQALIGLGKSLVSAGRAQEAVEPLEAAVKLIPQDPVAHYQLSFAYLRVGRQEEAQQQIALYRETHDRQQRASQAVRQGIVGDISQAQTAEPPE
jgi:tetratricopeptide (TPR) repeat protein